MDFGFPRFDQTQSQRTLPQPIFTLGQAPGGITQGRTLQTYRNESDVPRSEMLSGLRGMNPNVAGLSPRTREIIETAANTGADMLEMYPQATSARGAIDTNFKPGTREIHFNSRLSVSTGAVPTGDGTYVPGMWMRGGGREFMIDSRQPDKITVNDVGSGVRREATPEDITVLNNLTSSAMNVPIHPGTVRMDRVWPPYAKDR